MIKTELLIFSLTIGTLFVTNQSAHALSWSWSYKDNRGGFAQGTFTTGGTSYNSTDKYTISAINGSYKPYGSSIIPINSLNGGINNHGYSQSFKWSGTNSSPILVNNTGFAFNANDTSVYNYNILAIYSQSSIGFNTQGPYLQADSVVQQYSRAGIGGGTLSYSITSSNLKPYSATPVPFEFSPEQGFILGVPLFLGLRKLKKKRA